MRQRPSVLLVLSLAVVYGCALTHASDGPAKTPDVPYVPTRLHLVFAQRCANHY